MASVSQAKMGRFFVPLQLSSPLNLWRTSPWFAVFIPWPLIAHVVFFVPQQLMGQAQWHL
jgi:hypothetical protein